jgi:cyclic beta-1,2-glucan synthetase
MNRVGAAGQGESVWLGWLLHATLTAFAPIAAARGESARSTLWLAHAATLRTALERDAWDGSWYRRGYFDNGASLGSASNDECQIDSIAQSWAVISGAADTERATQAMAAVEERLIRRADGIAVLFAPPFNRTARDPGYIKGYPPGLRENGGQYTHAAAWSVIAFAKLGQGDQAAELFSMLNPVNHTRTRTGLQRYKAEPYVVAADVYSVAPHIGRAGWTWYTGAAGWLYRAGIESILGFNLRGDRMLMTPCIPRQWAGFQIRFRHGATRYEIDVLNPHNVSQGIVSATLDGVSLPAGEVGVALVDDGVTHYLTLTLGLLCA